MVEYRQKSDRTYDCIITIIKPRELGEMPNLHFILAIKDTLDAIIESSPNNSLTQLSQKLGPFTDTYFEGNKGIITINAHNTNFHIDIILAIVNGLKYLDARQKNVAVNILEWLPPFD